MRTPLVALILLTTAFATPGGADSTQWHAVQLQATPAGTLASGTWQVPETAPIATGFGEEAVITLEVAALGDAEWALLVYTVDDAARLVAGTVEAAYDVTTYLTAVLPSTETRGPSGAPRYLQIDATTYDGDVIIAPGDTLGFVVAARGSGPQEVFWHATDFVPGFADEPTSSASELYAALAVAPATPLATPGAGQGFHYAEYAEYATGLVGAAGVGGAPGLIGIQGATADVQVRENIPNLYPHGGIRDVTIASDYYATEGWAYSAAQAFTTQGAATWTYDIAGRAEHQESGVMIGAGVYTILIAPGPGHAAYGGGVGHSRADLDLFSADTNHLLMVQFQQLDLGTPLGDLFGVPAASAVDAPYDLIDFAMDLLTSDAQQES